MDTSEIVTMCHFDSSTPPVSPLSYDMASNIINIGPLSGIQCITLDQASVKTHSQQQQQQQHLQLSTQANNSILKMNNGKVPIPKITKTGLLFLLQICCNNYLVSPQIVK